MKQRFLPNGHLILFTCIFFFSACASQPSATPFRPPTMPVPTEILPTSTPVSPAFTEVPATTITATPSGPCTNNLSFLNDVTIQDNTIVQPGSSIDKQWLVQNSGTCNWNSTYHIKWIGGDTLGAAEEQLLYPAREGTQATLRILFTAPSVEDTYESAWQAVDPNGNVFGDLIYIKIVVSTQP